MTNQVQIINPIDSPRWDERILATGRATFFHSAAWAATLAETYRYRPCYFALLTDDQEIRAMVPLMEVQSFITGRRGVSLPFSDCCEHISENAIDTACLLACILYYGKKQGWNSLELRPGGKIAADRPLSNTYLGHTLSLSPGEEALFSSFRESTRRNIKKALAAEVICTTGNSLQAVEQFYTLNCLTRKRHGIPPQPFSFFRNVHKHILSRNMGNIVLAFHKEKAIAGAVYFHFGRRAMYKYGASNSDCQQLRANYLVMWHAIRHYARQGFESMDMGRTDPDNHGLVQYKNGWSTRSEEIAYYKYSLNKRLPLPLPKKSGPSFSERIVPHLPIPVLRIIGSVAYRHVA
ncbi:MAG: GNAT family N-acetyltransferase [Proteobacteria bacterium]|nr:GNAT family N-acetyltransferase [Pseudomonadota bacterium]MBU1739430.1 GNAT family N-acetyltransferase [Pseudomonadota bacterium]